jgi:hypothetical protein
VLKPLKAIVGELIARRGNKVFRDVTTTWQGFAGHYCRPIFWEGQYFRLCRFEINLAEMHAENKKWFNSSIPFHANATSYN